MSKRRDNGEGCIYREKRSGKWLGKFQIGYTSKGERKYKFCSGKTSKEVKLKMKELKAQFDQGIDVSNRAIKVGDYFDDWYSRFAIYNVTTSTRQNYEMIIRRHIKPYLGHIQLFELTSRDIQDFYNYLLHSGRIDGRGGLSPKTVENIHLVVSSGINHALKQGLLIRNPLLAVSLKRGTRPEIEIFTKEEQRLLIEECKNHHYGIAVKFAIFTGLRRGELLGLTWDCVDFEDKTVRINKQVQRNKNFTNKDSKTLLGFVKDTKTKKSRRTISVLPQMLDELKELKERQAGYKKMLGDNYKPHNLVFCREDGEFADPETFKSAYERILKIKKLPKRTLHALRHTFATRALEQGMNIKTLSRLMGHANIQITLDTYSHVLPEFEKLEVLKLGALYI